MPAMFRTTRRVEFAHTDAAGICHFSTFLLYMEQAEHEFLRSVGLSVLAHDDQGALTWPRVHVECDYQGMLRFEEIAEIELRVERLGEKSVTYAFAFSCQGRPIATGKTIAACCRLERGKPRSVPIPDDIRQKLSA